MNFNTPLSLAEFPEPHKIFTAKNGRLAVIYSPSDFYGEVARKHLKPVFAYHKDYMICDTVSGMLLEHVATANLIEGQISILVIVGSILTTTICVNSVIQMDLVQEFADNYDFNEQTNYSGAS